MGRKEVTVKLETITPLWTGDAWLQNKKIRPSSLLGSLRFWFSVYWKVIINKNTEKLNDKNVIADDLREFKDLRGKKATFRQILFERIAKREDYKCFDEVLDDVFEELGLPVPSRLFGCTGWKSRVDIRRISYKEEEIESKNLDFKFPFSKDSKFNTEFWIKKSLFNNENKVVLYKNIEFTLKAPNYWWDRYLSDFFSFYKDKIILVGGKLSFGFGMVKMMIEGSQEIQEINEQEINESNKNDANWNDIIRMDKIENIKYEKQCNVLGYNFRYFLRREEEKKYREKNFGKQGVASSIYVSNLIRDSSNHIYIYLINFNNPFSGNKNLSEKIFNNYKELLNEKLKSEGDRSV